MRKFCCQAQSNRNVKTHELFAHVCVITNSRCVSNGAHEAREDGAALVERAVREEGAGDEALADAKNCRYECAMGGRNGERKPDEERKHD
jgi:hypothetical protein